MTDEVGTVEPVEKPTVHEAWNRVMHGVQSISKDSQNRQQGFNFRGIDAVMNAVGPLLREHGVIVVPMAQSHEAERYTSKNGGQMCNRIVEMGFTVYGPRGDHFNGIAYGEAADSGDKSMTKAESVALRTFLLQSLMIPTDEPDPDSQIHERATPQQARGQQQEPRQQSRQQQKPPQEENPESKAARDDLKAIAEEQGWELEKIVAAWGKHNNTKPLRMATDEEVRAYTNLLLGGTITL
ncbi:bacteriophage protein [Mycobacteroides abscessus subsp. abscessus]|nr:bacteriophage protein [Mycobacteroides abscessus subsp. abscessus]